MAERTRSGLLTRLNIKARDGSNISFTEAEKNEALNSAIADPYVVKIVRDASITTAANTDNHAVPDGITEVLKVGLRIGAYGKPDDVDGWEVYDGRIYFDDLPPAGKTVVIVGSYKLTENDPIPENRQEYVLVLAKLQLVKYLQQSLANTFLTNDMTMADLLQLESTLSREAAMWRSKFTMQVVEL